MTPQEVLERAKQHLLTYGWVQFVQWTDLFHPEASSACLFGAVRVAAEATESHQMDYPVFQAAVSALRKIVGPNVGTWNDTKGRTVEEVVAALDRAVARLDSSLVTV